MPAGLWGAKVRHIATIALLLSMTGVSSHAGTSSSDCESAEVLVREHLPKGTELKGDLPYLLKHTTASSGYLGMIIAVMARLNDPAKQIDDATLQKYLEWETAFECFKFDRGRLVASLDTEDTRSSDYSDIEIDRWLAPHEDAAEQFAVLFPASYRAAIKEAALLGEETDELKRQREMVEVSYSKWKQANEAEQN